MDTRTYMPSVLSVDFAKVALRGAGQVMFQGNAWTGLFFLAGIFYGAYATGTPDVAWGALIGLLVSTLTGYLLGLPVGKGIQGLWGFNGILVGCAFPTFLGDVPLMWLALIFFSAMSTWVMVGMNNLLAPMRVSAFTFPFVFITWVVLLASRNLHGLPDSALGSPHLPGYALVPVGEMDGWEFIKYWLKGISQVFLINSWITGVLFLIGLGISNRWAAIWAAVASLVALLVALLYHGNGSDIANGLFGFSPVLTGIALGITFYQVSWRTAIWSLLGIIATVFIQAGMDVLLSPFGIPTLTGPFCVATWLFLWPHMDLNKKVLNA